ncbi:MAG: hypothetical protein U9P90_01620 [Patescibacteria group bacterium]|nr:hypothetical protein [Patescibacteria group bacterium]
MKPDFLNPSPTISSDGFFVLQKPNCYLQDGMLQTDFVAYNLSLEDINLTEEVMYKLNVCPSHALQTFQAIETQMHNIKPLVEQEIA